MLNTVFGVTGISESKQQAGKVAIVNTQINGYSVYCQPSNASSGGCVVYVNSNLDHHIRDDLSIETDFETIWIEIKNHKRQNDYDCSQHMTKNVNF